MKRQRIQPDMAVIPAVFHPLVEGAAVYDSSCSPEARVFFIDRDGGYYLKTSAKGTLQTEAEMTRFFHEKQLGAAVLDYLSEEADWLLTERVDGEDGTHPLYLEDPRRLCDTTATLLRQLHEIDPSGCPVLNRTQTYLDTVRQNYRAGMFDASLFSAEWQYPSAEEAYAVAESHAHLLRADTLLHGDYCLPNVMLKDWRFSGFIDLGNGGVGDRHIDLFWGVWTLLYNLKTDRYRERFLDAYGRDRVEPDMLRVIAAMEVFG